MTAPLTPRNQPAHESPEGTQDGPRDGSQDGPRDGSQDGTSDTPGSAPWRVAVDGLQDDGPGLAVEVRDAAVALVAVALTGVLLGLLWLWLAPRVPMISDGRAVYFDDVEGEQAVGADGTFILLALAMGAVTAVGVFLWRRRGGIPLVIGLALGGLLGSVVAWWLGVWIGPSGSLVDRAKEAGKDVVIEAPLKLRAMGALLVWPIAAMLVHLGLTTLFGPRDPDPYADLYMNGPGRDGHPYSPAPPAKD